jgi:hypothetical protein
MPGPMGVPAMFPSSAYVCQRHPLITNYIIKREESQIEAAKSTATPLIPKLGSLCTGMVSASGASPALLLLPEVGQVAITVSEQVVAEMESAVGRKIFRAARRHLGETGALSGKPDPVCFSFPNDLDQLPLPTSAVELPV